MATLTFVPEAHEQQYYEGLFQAADVGRQGQINGGEAVAFFTRSQLSVDTLKNIWTVSDNPATGVLDRTKFAIAVRLIQLAQNGHKAQGANLAAPDGVQLKPVFFDGVSGVTIQMPPAAPAPTPTPAAPITPTPAYGQPPPPTPQAQPQPQPQLQPPTPATGLVPPPVMSNALTTQDPYGMTPQDQANYEKLFPTYATKDDHVYGSEAVALFGKSGLPQEQLGAIWNMVDQPVDNKLDRLEFAMAMHLIVCVSRKNLPMPTALPMSMKQLKSEPSGGPPPLPTMDGPPPLSGVPTADSNDVAPTGFGVAGASGASVGAGSMAAGSMASGMAGPPPLDKVGGLDISDAFEGLSANEPYVSTLPGANGFGGAPPAAAGGFGEPPAPSTGGFGEPPAPEATSSYIPEPTPASAPAPTPSFSMGGGLSMVETVAEDTIPEPEPTSSYMPEPTPAPAPVPKSSGQLAQSYQMGDGHTELNKLKDTLQKLQAENISLKAQLGNVSEEERDVAKETAATVEEINKLSAELSLVRNQVLDAKTKLLESTAELAAAKEKKGVLTDLISETTATKEALESANRGIGEANQNLAAPEQKAAAANTAAAGFEADLFGFGGPIGGAPAPTLAPAPPVVAAAAPPPVAAPDTDYGLATASTDSSLLPPAATPAPDAPTPSYGDSIWPTAPPAAATPAPVAESTPAPAPTMPAGTTIAGKSELEKLRKEALAAQQAAQEAEDTRRTLAIEADKLRQQADDAESEARALSEKASTKKRGFGRGKKNLQKDADKAHEEVGEKRKHFMEMQMQANNAQTIAMETKREAERLRQEVEQGELALAAAESVQDTQPAPAPAPEPAPVEEPTQIPGGLPGGGLYGGGLPPLGTAGGLPPLGTGPGLAAPPSYEGFGNIMGGSGSSGTSIPTPQAGGGGASDPYSNPFGSI